GSAHERGVRSRQDQAGHWVPRPKAHLRQLACQIRRANAVRGRSSRAFLNDDDRKILQPPRAVSRRRYDPQTRAGVRSWKIKRRRSAVVSVRPCASPSVYLTRELSRESCVGVPAMDIFDPSKVTMAKLILESTSHRYYAREVHDITGLSYPIIYGNFSAFERAGFVVRKEEDWG